MLFSCKGKPATPLSPKPNPPTIVDVLVAQPQTVNNTVEVNGSVIASEFVELHPEVSGRLTYLNVPEGKTVEAGTVIARINDADLKAQIGKTNVQLDLAEKTEARYKQLLAVNGINQSDYDAALNQVNSLKADIVYTQTLLDKTVIKAPFKGVAGLRQVSPGAYVTPATVVSTLQQVNQVKIDFTVPEVYSDVIKVGASVDVSLDENTHKKGKANIVAVEPGANTDTRNLKVRALLVSGTANPGAFVKVYVESGNNSNSILVPSNCIIPDDKNSQLVVVKNGKAEFVSVKTGLRTANTVEIKSGLNAGDSVVITGELFARPKSLLKVRSVKKVEDIIVKSNN